MIKKVTYYDIICDSCGKSLTEESETCYPDTDSCLLVARQSGWLHTNDGHHYCPDCHTLNDEDQWECKDGNRYDYEGNENTTSVQDVVRR